MFLKKVVHVFILLSSFESWSARASHLNEENLFVDDTGRYLVDDKSWTKAMADEKPATTLDSEGRRKLSPFDSFPFPSPGSTVVSSVGFMGNPPQSAGYFWTQSRGDRVTQTVSSQCASIDEVKLDLFVERNGLNQGAFLNWELFVNGVSLTTFTVNQGFTGPISLDVDGFAPIAGPAYAVEIRVTNVVPGGRGSHTWGLEPFYSPSSIRFGCANPCCTPEVTDTIEGDKAVYFAANGREGFVACYATEYDQLPNFGYQDCPMGHLWNGENGSDGLDPAAFCLGPAVVAVGDPGDDYCIVGDWTPPPPPMGCCSDGVDGTFPIDDCSQFVMCTGGVQSDPFDCPDGLLFKQTGPGVGWCDWAAQVDCPLDTCMPMAGQDRRLGLDADHKLRGVAGH